MSDRLARGSSTQDKRTVAWHFDRTLELLQREYMAAGHAIEVDFRQLVPLGPGIDRATHLVHSYPAKLLPNIPLLFLNCEALTPRAGLVYDPFCGTGTVLVEALLAGLRVAGADSNPLARLITAAKTTHIESDGLYAGLQLIERRSSQCQPATFAPVVNVEKWFVRPIRDQLGRLKTAIDSVEDIPSRDFFRVALSQTIRKVSLADPRMSVPVRPKRLRSGSRLSALEVFKDVAVANIGRLAWLPRGSAPTFIGDDARGRLRGPLGGLAKADLVVTSPPYAGAQKYVRASSLSLGWLGMTPDNKLRNLETLNIGREHLTAIERERDWSGEPRHLREILQAISDINPVRASILHTYLHEMRVAAKAISLSLKRTGHLVLVMGDNQFCGLPVRTSSFVRELFEAEGLSLKLELVDAIRSRGLMTKRNRTAGLIAREHVFLFTS